MNIFEARGIAKHLKLPLGSAQDFARGDVWPVLKVMPKSSNALQIKEALQKQAEAFAKEAEMLQARSEALNQTVLAVSQTIVMPASISTFDDIGHFQWLKGRYDAVKGIKAVAKELRLMLAKAENTNYPATHASVVGLAKSGASSGYLIEMLTWAKDGVKVSIDKAHLICAAIFSGPNCLKLLQMEPQAAARTVLSIYNDIQHHDQKVA